VGQLAIAGSGPPVEGLLPGGEPGAPGDPGEPGPPTAPGLPPALPLPGGAPPVVMSSPPAAASTMLPVQAPHSAEPNSATESEIGFNPPRIGGHLTSL
jgi:hypothetical protein